MELHTLPPRVLTSQKSKRSILKVYVQIAHQQGPGHKYLSTWSSKNKQCRWGNCHSLGAGNKTSTSTVLSAYKIPI